MLIVDELTLMNWKACVKQVDELEMWLGDAVGDISGVCD